MTPSDYSTLGARIYDYKLAIQVIPTLSVAPPSRRLSGGHHARRAEGEDALGTAGKDAGAT